MAAVNGDDLSIDRAAVLFGYCIACGASWLLEGVSALPSLVEGSALLLPQAARETSSSAAAARGKSVFQMFHAIPSFAIKLYTGSFPGRRGKIIQGNVKMVHKR